jgi:N-formylglutamate amidohydrolase
MTYPEDADSQGRRLTMTQFDGELSPPFEIVEPAEWRAPIIFNSPHSGSVYPHEFLNASRIDLGALRRSEDSFMDELITDLSNRGFPVVRVNFPRSYVDVNREPYELDPRMFSGRLPSFANTRSMRVAGGLGTIPRVVGDGQEIYRERLSVDDALGRIEALYKPYHRALRRLINRAHQAFGTVVVVDCHSMPSIGVSRDEPRRPDMVIGDRYGTSCAALLPNVVEVTLTALGYSVGRNKPYAGGFITEHYGNPPADCIPSSSNSIARSTWTSGGANADRAFRKSLPISQHWPMRWPRCRSTSSGRSRRRRNRDCLPVNSGANAHPSVIPGRRISADPE